uniref:Uncharacterized protein n=1 Tax=Phlebotomus papatasi TaxID=29031 RepID=A0A1B0DE07_PHLPP
DATKTPLADEFSLLEGSSTSLSRVPKPEDSAADRESVLNFSRECQQEVQQEKYYTRVRNVKKAHQIQEIGEFQEMDDDVEYILDALQPHNPISTRCLSAIQLSSKALRDATKDQSLGLCTATIMFVLSQDNLNMDLDRDSLELMLSLLESDVSHADALDDAGLSLQQLQRNKQKVRELCEEVKSHGKAQHLNLDNITVGTLAMETLLSLTSKRAGEWFKEELRNLGGLEHIINTICECCRQISDYVVGWTDALLDKLRKIERCLRVLENVMEMNEQNQSYILGYRNGHAIETLVKLYKLCDREIALYPTNDQTPKENPGVVIREALVPTLKVLIALTHPFNDRAVGAVFLGEKEGLFDTSLHLLLQAPNYVPEKCIFELSILVLLLLINLTMYTKANRSIIMEANALSDFGSQFAKVPAIKALVEFFYKCEELARMAERNTDDLLESNPKKYEKKHKTAQEEVEETVTKLLQKAGHHMEHTMLASYVCLLLGHLLMDNAENEKKIRPYLRDATFDDMVKVLEKYYNFMNLTASSEASVVAHIKWTKGIIDYLTKCDSHSSSHQEAVSSTAPSVSRAGAPGGYSYGTSHYSTR